MKDMFAKRLAELEGPDRTNLTVLWRIINEVNAENVTTEDKVAEIVHEAFHLQLGISGAAVRVAHKWELAVIGKKGVEEMAAEDEDWQEVGFAQVAMSMTVARPLIMADTFAIAAAHAMQIDQVGLAAEFLENALKLRIHGQVLQDIAEDVVKMDEEEHAEAVTGMLNWLVVCGHESDDDKTTATEAEVTLDA